MVAEISPPQIQQVTYGPYQLFSYSNVSAASPTTLLQNQAKQKELANIQL